MKEANSENDSRVKVGLADLSSRAETENLVCLLLPFVTCIFFSPTKGKKKGEKNS